MLAPRGGERRATFLICGLCGIDPFRFLPRFERALPAIESRIDRRVADHPEAPRPSQLLAAHRVNVGRRHAVGDIDADQNPPGARLIPRPAQDRLQQRHQDHREDRDSQTEQPIADGA